jgi:hypothetical protein
MISQKGSKKLKQKNLENKKEEIVSNVDEELIQVFEKTGEEKKELQKEEFINDCVLEKEIKERTVVFSGVDKKIFLDEIPLSIKEFIDFSRLIIENEPKNVRHECFDKLLMSFMIINLHNQVTLSYDSINKITSSLGF